MGGGVSGLREPGVLRSFRPDADRVARARLVTIPEGTGDEINARAVASFQGWTREAVRSAFDHSYGELLECVKSLPKSAFEAGSSIEQALDDTVHGALANNTYEHWPIHEAQIRAWLET